MARRREGYGLERAGAVALLAALACAGCAGSGPQALGAGSPAAEEPPVRDEAAARGAPRAARSRLVVPASARDQGALQAALDSPATQEAAAGCREGQRRLGALPPGGLTLGLTVEPDGEVSAVALAEGTPPAYRASYLAGCLSREARTFPFPPLDTPSAVYFEIEFPVE